MADTGAPSGAPGASQGAARTSLAPETVPRTTTISAPPAPDTISVIHLRNSSRTSDILDDVPENLGKPVEPDNEDLVPTPQDKIERVVVEHGHQLGVLAMLGEKPELREKQVTKVGQMSEVNQQSVEEASQNMGEQSSRESTKSQQLKTTTLVNQAPSQSSPTPIPTLVPSFQSTVASQESTLKNVKKINDIPESNDNPSSQRDQSLETQPVEREEIIGEEALLKQGDVERRNQVEEGIQVQEMEGGVGPQMKEGDLMHTENDTQGVPQNLRGRISVPAQENEREGRLVETSTTEGNSDDQQQGLMGLLAKSRLAVPSSDSPSVTSGERSDLEEQGDKVIDRVNSDLPLPPQLVGSVSDEEGPTKAESDPPTHPNNVTANTSSTSTPSISSTSSSRKAPQETPSGDLLLVSSTPQGARTTQPMGFHTSGVSSNSTSLLSGN